MRQNERRRIPERRKTAAVDRTLFVPTLVVVVAIAVIVGTAIFFLWAAQYFGRRLYRRIRRRHLYRPIDVKVLRVGDNGRYGATLYVEYEHGGAIIAHRLLTTRDVGRLAEQLKYVSLLVDPDYPRDAIVDPSFALQASRLNTGCRRETLAIKAIDGVMCNRKHEHADRNIRDLQRFRLG
jgi:hypothetical protein